MAWGISNQNAYRANAVGIFSNQIKSNLIIMFNKIYLFFALSAIAAIGVIVMQAFMFHMFFTWFIAPLFGIGSLSFAQSIGVYITGKYLLSKNNKNENEKRKKERDEFDEMEANGDVFGIMGKMQKMTEDLNEQIKYHLKVLLAFLIPALFLLLFV